MLSWNFLLLLCRWLFGLLLLCWRLFGLMLLC